MNHDQRQTVHALGEQGLACGRDGIFPPQDYPSVSYAGIAMHMERLPPALRTLLLTPIAL